MLKYLLLIGLTCIIIPTNSQTTQLNTSFTKKEVKDWMISSLNKVILYESVTHIKPRFTFNDTAFIVSLPNAGRIGKTLVTSNYIFDYKGTIIMNWSTSNEDGSHKELFEFFTRNLTVDFTVDPTLSSDKIFRLNRDCKTEFLFSQTKETKSINYEIDIGCSNVCFLKCLL